MTPKERETLERQTDFNYAWYKENVLDKRESDTPVVEKVEEPESSCENIPPHHMAAIDRGLAYLEARRTISGADFRKEMRRKRGL